METYTVRLQELDLSHWALSTLRAQHTTDPRKARLLEELLQSNKRLAWVLYAQKPKEATESPQTPPEPEYRPQPTPGTLKALYALRTGLRSTYPLAHAYPATAGTFMWHEPARHGGIGIYVPAVMKYLQTTKVLKLEIGEQVWTWPLDQRAEAEAFHQEILRAPPGTRFAPPAPEVLYLTPNLKKEEALQNLAKAPKVTATLHHNTLVAIPDPYLEYDQTLLTRTGTFHPGPKYYTFSTDRALSQGKTQDLVLKDGLVTLPRKDGSFITYQALT